MSILNQFTGGVSAFLNDLMQVISKSDIEPGGARDTGSNLVFTSTFRQLKLANTLGLDLNSAEISDFGITDSIRKFGVGLEPAAREKVQNYLVGAKQYTMPVITMVVNPATIRFEQPKRISSIQTMGGTTHLMFTDRAGYNNDVLTLTMSGSSGDIDLRGFRTGDYVSATTSLRKLLVWLNLYGLTLERTFIPAIGMRNLIHLTFVSKALPRVIEFTGHFANVMQFEERGDSPFSIDYTLNFVVQQTNPPMVDFIEKTGQFLTDVQTTVSRTATILGPGDISTL